jgi:hypothetical protein
MEYYLNQIIETNENESFNNEHKLNFINAITLDTFSSSDKNIMKYSMTPQKIKSDKPVLILNKNIIDKEITSDIDTTKNMSEKNTYKNNSRKDLKNENENNRYNNIKDDNNDLTIEKTENKQNIKVRRDIFGSEIKKGGKHRISFADNAHILRSRNKLPNGGTLLYRNRHRKSVDLENINSNNDIQKVRSIRRSLIDLQNDKFKRKYDFENSDKKIKSLVEVIEIQNYKEFNKITDDYIPEENKNSKDIQETVCCSGTCLIY